MCHLFWRGFRSLRVFNQNLTSPPPLTPPTNPLIFRMDAVDACRCLRDVSDLFACWSVLSLCPAIAILFTSLRLSSVKTAVATRCCGACFANGYGVHRTRSAQHAEAVHFLCTLLQRTLLIYSIYLVTITKSSTTST